MILGQFIKQPLEIESYSIQFVEDLADTDEAQASWCMIVERDETEPSQVLFDQFEVTQTGQAYYTEENIELSLSVEGSTVAIGNKSQVSPLIISADSIQGSTTFSLDARTSVFLRRTADQWVVEAKASSSLVSIPGDQRVRTFVEGGVDGNKYKAEITIQTKEGRVLQSEFLVRIKDS